eukprot:CAMPEP_0178764978 /NCGR_PEP_ID=MMETSP0744-20121128/18151_1 /TAXON_ID=913974 /ORGANISM="Nitzschia punctata, Strain CCMP561" /LENGTH=121 /DNA_ID=CAMNT_0020420333 /DNA_START=63 /DNA_END=429 /DNA_ORIENTATION=-
MMTLPQALGSPTQSPVSSPLPQPSKSLNSVSSLTCRIQPPKRRSLCFEESGRKRLKSDVSITDILLPTLSGEGEDIKDFDLGIENSLPTFRLYQEPQWDDAVPNDEEEDSQQCELIQGQTC